MSYHINDLGDDRFELVEVRRTVLGVLTNRQIAEHFADYLDILDAAAFAADDPLPAPAPASSDVPPAFPSAQSMVVPLSVAADPVAPTPETPLAEALRRLEAGEQLGVVADELGIPMPRLRGIWAKRVRDQKEAIAVGTCTGCAREYRPGAQDEGLCARCTRDLGRG